MRKKWLSGLIKAHRQKQVNFLCKTYQAISHTRVKPANAVQVSGKRVCEGVFGTGWNSPLSVVVIRAIVGLKHACVEGKTTGE